MPEGGEARKRKNDFMTTTEQEILTRFSLAKKKLKDYEPLLTPYFPNKHERLDACKRVALMFEVTSLWKEYKVNEIFEMGKVVFDGIDKPKLSNLQSFYNLFITKLPKFQGSILEAIIHYVKTKPRGNGRGKTSEVIVKLIIATYAHPDGYNCQKIASTINDLIRIDVRDYGVEYAIEKYKIQNTNKQKLRLLAGNYIKVSTVKKYLNVESKNVVYDLRYGKKAGREKEMPLPRLNALHAMDRIEFDSTVFSFIHSDSNGKATIKLYVSLVIDCFSNRIIGYAFGKSESAKLALTSFRNAFNTLEILPPEIFTDRFPGYNNEELKHFREQLEKLGCKLWFDRTGNPRSKGKVEKAIDIVCELAKQYPNYLGKNITTKRRDSRKPLEVVAEMSKPKNLESLAYVKGQIVELLALYNSLAGQGESLTRSEKFNSSEKPNAISLTLEDRVWLFHKVDIKKVENGLIIFRRGQYRDHITYQINDYKVRLRNGGQVRVRYTDQSLERGEDIYLFDPVTDELMCTCSPKLKPHLAIVNQSENDIKIIEEHIEDKKRYRDFVREKQNELGYSPIEITNYMNASKLEVLNAEELYTLRLMMDDPKSDLDSELIPIQDNDRGFALLGKSRKSVDPLNRKISTGRRLDGYERPLPLEDPLNLEIDNKDIGCDPV